MIVFFFPRVLDLLLPLLPFYGTACSAVLQEQASLLSFLSGPRNPKYTSSLLTLWVRQDKNQSLGQPSEKPETRFMLYPFSSLPKKKLWIEHLLPIFLWVTAGPQSPLLSVAPTYPVLVKSVFQIRQTKTQNVLYLFFSSPPKGKAMRKASLLMALSCISLGLEQSRVKWNDSSYMFQFICSLLCTQNIAIPYMVSAVMIKILQSIYACKFVSLWGNKAWDFLFHHISHSYLFYFLSNIYTATYKWFNVWFGKNKYLCIWKEQKWINPKF